MKKWLFAIILFLVISAPVSSHPGNTASDGCHYCRTNCDYWGVPWYERHCHGGYTYTPQTISAVDYTFPQMNATYTWTPNNDGKTFNLDVTLNDPSPSRYSVTLEKCKGCNPGPLVDFTTNHFHFANKEPGIWYMNAKKEIGNYWSTISYWTIEIPPWYHPIPTHIPYTPAPTIDASIFNGINWIVVGCLGIAAYLFYVLIKKTKT